LRSGCVLPRVKFDLKDRRQSIRADLAQVKQARDFADEVAADFGFDASARYALKLAMSEAVTNAIQHGSTSTADQITIWAEAGDGALTFYVRDTGQFIPHVRNGDELPESGRGLEFIRGLMDDMDLRPGADGTLVRFSKRI
jgi:anti-sigma regulatory factor (Ser/Thr protein kinase)